MKRHLCYLCPEMIVLRLYIDGLSEWKKERMASELRQTPHPVVFQRGKPGQPLFQPLAAHLTPERPPLAMFLTERSWLVFHLLDIDMVHINWLTLPPSACHGTSSKHTPISDFPSGHAGYQRCCRVGSEGRARICTHGQGARRYRQCETSCHRSPRTCCKSLQAKP